MPINMNALNMAQDQQTTKYTSSGPINPPTPNAPCATIKYQSRCADLYMQIIHACRNMFILAHPHPLATIRTHLNTSDDGTMVNSMDDMQSRNDEMERQKWLGNLYCTALLTTHPTRQPMALKMKRVEYSVYYLCQSAARWGKSGPNALTMAPQPRKKKQYIMNNL